MPNLKNYQQIYPTGAASRSYSVPGSQFQPRYQNQYQNMFNAIGPSVTNIPEQGGPNPTPSPVNPYQPPAGVGTPPPGVSPREWSNPIWRWIWMQNNPGYTGEQGGAGGNMYEPPQYEYQKGQPTNSGIYKGPSGQYAGPGDNIQPTPPIPTPVRPELVTGPPNPVEVPYNRGGPGGNMENVPPPGVSQREWDNPIWRRIWLHQNQGYR